MASIVINHRREHATVQLRLSFKSQKIRTCSAEEYGSFVVLAIRAFPTSKIEVSREEFAVYVQFPVGESIRSLADKAENLGKAWEESLP